MNLMLAAGLLLAAWFTLACVTALMAALRRRADARMGEALRQYLDNVQATLSETPAANLARWRDAARLGPDAAR